MKSQKKKNNNNNNNFIDLPQKIISVSDIYPVFHKLLQITKK